MKESHLFDFPYPTVIEAMPAISTVLSKLDGNEVETHCLVHSLYIVLGYGLSQVLPHIHGAAAPFVEATELKTELQKILDQPAAINTSAIDYRLIVDGISDMLTEY